MAAVRRDGQCRVHRPRGGRLELPNQDRLAQHLPIACRLYATAGGAVGDFRLRELTSGASLNPTAPLGWTAGAGIEYAFNDAISAISMFACDPFAPAASPVDRAPSTSRRFVTPQMRRAMLRCVLPAASCFDDSKFETHLALAIATFRLVL